jgi:hypothetical protein
MVSVSYTQHWRLRRIDRWMRRSDPHLAAMLAIFARLTAGEAIASSEQAGFRRMRAWRHLVRLRAAAWLLITYACRAFRWIGHAVTRPWSGRERSWLGLGAGHERSHAGERFE